MKLIVFDLDGVLVDSKKLHYESLNIALNEIDNKYIISLDDHLKKFDGLPTKKKLEILTKDRNLSTELYEKIWKRKQEITFNLIKENIKPNEVVISLMKKLKKDGFIIYVASNSIKQSLKLFLLSLGVMEYVDDFISNEDVKNSKPHPEMYLYSMVKAGALPSETMIVEDSNVGIIAARESGANVCIVKNPEEVTIDNIYKHINKIKIKINNKWVDKNLNIIIPMSGAGSRFLSAGYTFPKPLIDIKNKPMIQIVVENLNIEAVYTYIVRKEHYEKYNLKYLLNIITPNCNIIQVDNLTEGAACSVLLSKKIIDNENPVLIANSDQFIEWNSSEFMYSMMAGNSDGGILTFEGTHPKWSYVLVDKDNFITEVQEKKVISNIANVGIYFFKKGNEFVKYAEQMIEKNIRTNNEFYIAPIYNEYIFDNKLIKNYKIEKMWGLGTPEDLQYFLNNYKGL